MSDKANQSLDHDDKAPSSRQFFPLFNLPRELRNLVYHHLFLATPLITQTFGKSSLDCTLIYNPPNPPFSLTDPSMYFPSTKQTPEWLLANKTMLFEAYKQFLRHAEWYFISRPRNYGMWTTKLNLKISRVRRIQLYVDNLANWETPARQQGTDSRPHLERVARAMKRNGWGFEVVTLVGHSYMVGEDDWTCNGQAETMARNLMKVFEGVEVETWRFGLRDAYRLGLWVLFDVEGGEGKEVLVARECANA